jgi:hypothetical protein
LITHRSKLECLSLLRRSLIFAGKEPSMVVDFRKGRHSGRRQPCLQILELGEGKE